MTLLEILFFLIFVYSLRQFVRMTPSLPQRGSTKGRIPLTPSLIGIYFKPPIRSYRNWGGCPMRRGLETLKRPLGTPKKRKLFVIYEDFYRAK